MEESGDMEALARSVEDVHHLRLMALLEDLVREKNGAGAAQTLGVDPRTLLTSLRRGALSMRMRLALDRLLISGETPASARQQERLEALEANLAGLHERWKEREKTLPETIATEVRVAVEAAGKALREEFGQAMAEMPTRAGVGHPAEGEAGPDGDGTAVVDRQTRTASYPRPDPGLVTREPYPGEEESYGAGMESVARWRKLNRERQAGTKLEQVWVRQEIMALEIAMIGEYELTLPPNAQALHPSQREDYLGWRRREFVRIRRERLRCELLHWVRVILTLGRWKR